jgi:glycerophosphoryl diester phosphodiesterase
MSLTYENRMTVAAHRGDSYNYYENTLSAFKGAIDSGTDMIETDVHLTKDNELVLIHDDKVDRTTNGHGYVRDFTLEELSRLNAGDIYSYEKIPTLTELFELIKDTDITLNIEIKEYHLEGNEERCALCIDSVLELVSKYGLDDRILINSFDAWVLEYVYKKHGKKYALHGFYPYHEMFNVSSNPDEYLYCACIFEKDKREHYEYLESKGIQPWIGASITQKASLEMCLKYGARLITTNNPADIIEKLKEIKNGRK